MKQSPERMIDKKIIAIETSTEACSAALYLAGEVREVYRLAPRGHTELILAMIDGLLAEAGVGRSQLDVVAFGRGPGAFTGVRIGASVAQGIAFALDIPVAPVSTLAALAHGAWRELGHTHAVAAIDARMGEVYYGSYTIVSRGDVLQVGEEGVAAPARVPVPAGEGWFGVGSGWQSYAEPLAARFGAAVSGFDGERFPHAHDVALIGAQLVANGGAVAADQALPVYLRDQVVQKKGTP